MSTEDTESLSIVTYEDKKYNLCKIPPITSLVVANATKDIEDQLRLKTLGNDLSRLGKFVRLAYCGVVGHVDLQIKVRQTLKNVSELCDDTVHTINNFKRSSQDALESMQCAYDYLAEGLEEEALVVFDEIQMLSKKMSENSKQLSIKCKSESENIKEVGNTTLLKKEAVKVDKQEAEALLSVNTTEKKVTVKELENTTATVAESKEEIAKTYMSEDKIFEKKSELGAQQQKELEDEHKIYKEEMNKLQSALDSNIEKITKELKEKEENIRISIKDNKDALSKKIEALEETLRGTIQSAENDYANQIKFNETDMQNTLKENKEKYEETLKANKEEHTKAIAEVDKTYDKRMKKIQNSYGKSLDTNKEELERQTKHISETLEHTLAKSSRQSELESNDCWFNSSTSVIKQKQAAEDAATKIQKTSEEDKYISEKIAADKGAYDTKSREESKAENTRSEAIKKVNEAKSQSDEHASNERERKDENTRLRKKEADDKARKDKSERIQMANSEKQKAQSDATKEKEDSDNSAKLAYEKETSKIEKNKTEILSKYKDDIQQIKQTLELAEKRIQNKYKTESDMLGEELDFLEKRKLTRESEVAKLLQKKEEAYRKMLEITKKIAENKDQIEVTETSLTCLHEAVSALRKIEDTMVKAGIFWEEVGELCAEVTGNRLSKQVERIKSTEDSKRMKIWKSTGFKRSALLYYGKWVALKDTCITSGKYITFAQDEIHRYVCDHPTRGQAVELIQQLAPLLEKEILLEQKSIMNKSSD